LVGLEEKKKTTDQSGAAEGGGEKRNKPYKHKKNKTDPVV